MGHADCAGDLGGPADNKEKNYTEELLRAKQVMAHCEIKKKRRKTGAVGHEGRNMYGPRKDCGSTVGHAGHRRGPYRDNYEKQFWISEKHKILLFQPQNCQKFAGT